MEDLNIQDLIGSITKGSVEALNLANQPPTADSLRDLITVRIEALLQTPNASPVVAAELQSLSSLLDTVIHNKEALC